MELMDTKGIYGLDAGLVDCLKTLKGSRQQGDRFEVTADKVSKTIDKYSISPEINPDKYKAEFISFFSQHQSSNSERNNRIMNFLKNLEPKNLTNPKAWNIDSQDKKYILSLNESFSKSRSNGYYSMQSEQLAKGRIREVEDLTVENIVNLDRSLQHFNSVTINWNMSMGHCIQSDGQIRTDEAKKCYDFCKENGLKMRALGIIYPSEMPRIDMQNMSSDQILGLFENYMSELSSACPDIECMDILNEMSSLSVMGQDENDSDEPVLNNCVLNEKIGNDYYIKMMAIARKYFPNTKMLYNGIGHENPKMVKNIFKIVDKIQEYEKQNGVKLLDGIGMQCRLDSNNSKVENIQIAIDEARKRDLEVQVTELDVVQCKKDDNGIELSQMEAEKRQADIYRQVHQLIFKNKDVVKGVTYGDMSDKLSWSKNHVLYENEENAAPTIYDDSGLPKQHIVDAINEGIQSGMDEYLEMNPDMKEEYEGKDNIVYLPSSPSASIISGGQQKGKSYQNYQTHAERE